MTSLLSSLEWLEQLGPVMKEAGLALESCPDAWRLLWNVPALRTIGYLDVPKRFNPYPFCELPFGCDECSYTLRLQIVEYLARFDASSLLALPGSSLSTKAVAQLGSKAQTEWFFDRFRAGPEWAFLAITEMTGGSDVALPRAQLSRTSEGYVLTARKTLIGGAHFASVGVVFASVPGSLQPLLIMVEPAKHPEHMLIESLPTLGLKGAYLCRVTANDFPVSQAQVLGVDSRRLSRSLDAIATIFEHHRPIVAALALGTGRGLMDTVEREGFVFDTMQSLRLEYAALYNRMLALGLKLERSGLRGHEASLFKWQATGFAERVARALAESLPPRHFLHFPELRKRYRDALAFEYMEGTKYINMLNSYRSYVSDKTNNGTPS